MTYDEALDFIHSAEKYGSVLGLSSMARLMSKLGNIQDKLKIIHIAGTNGKGSVGAFLGSILKCSGFKTGRYVSPSVIDYFEKFQIDGNFIEKDVFSNLCGQVMKAVFEIVREGKEHPTVFEVETAIAFLYFYEENCDLVLLETGLGGRLDATNVLRANICSVITSISIDHTLFLGNSIDEIAFEKCGIIKNNCPLVYIEQECSVNDVIQKVCCERKSKSVSVLKKDINYIGFDYDDYSQLFDYKDYKNLKIKLLGKFQVENASLAIGVAELLIELGYNISKKNIYYGLVDTVWQGRFQILRKNPLFIVDGAHNFDAVRRFRETVELFFAGKKIVFIVGIFSDKEYKKMVSLTADLAGQIYTIDLKSSRGLDKETLMSEFSKYNKNTKIVNSIEEAIDKSILAAGNDGVIIAFGSLSYLGEVIEIIKKEKNYGYTEN